MQLSSKIKYKVSFIIRLRLSLKQSNGKIKIRVIIYASCMPKCIETLTACDEIVINKAIQSTMTSLLNKNTGMNSLAFLVFKDTFLGLSASMI